MFVIRSRGFSPQTMDLESQVTVQQTIKKYSLSFTFQLKESCI